MTDTPKKEVNLPIVAEKLRLAFLKVLIDERDEQGAEIKISSTDILCLLSTLSFQLSAAVFGMSYKASHIHALEALLTASLQATAKVLASHADKQEDLENRDE